MMCNCTAIGAEFGDARPLDEARMRAMTVNGIQLLDLIDSNDAFLSELASPTVGVITWPQRDHLVHIVQPRDRNDKLLEFLTRRSVANFHKFTRVLSKYQAHLVQLLVTDGGETSDCVSKMMSYLSHTTFVTVACLFMLFVSTLHYMVTLPSPFLCYILSSIPLQFLPSDAMLAWYMPSSCLCVCLSHSSIVSKRLNVGSRKQRRTIAP